MMLTPAEFRASHRAVLAARRRARSRDRILFGSAPIDADSIIQRDTRATIRFNAVLLVAFLAIVFAAIFAA